MRFLPRIFPLLLLALSSALLLPPRPAAAQRPSGPEVELSRVTPQTPVATTIAIATFEVTGSSGGVDPQLFLDVIYNDLDLFSYFERAKNQTFVEQTHRQDLRAGRIDFTEWRRLDASFVLKGAFSSVNDRITADCYLYDVERQQRVFGTRYPECPIGAARRLAHQISDDVAGAVFKTVPIANTQIVFVSRRGSSSHKEIYLMDADGHDARRLTFDNTLAQTPCWGQNGTEIYYTSHKDWNPDLFGMQLGTMKTWPISYFPKMNYAANWSPQRERIVLTLGKDGNSEFYTMDRNGKPKSLQRLTWTPGIDSSPCWNPAGNQIVFVSDRTGTPQIHIMHADGTGTRLLTRLGSYNQSPVWSPKGDLIAYSSRGEDGHHNICTIRLDGTDRRRLTYKQGNNEDPAWAPDGEHLVFASDRQRFSEFQIYIMRTDGSNQRLITDQSNNHSPAWSPGPAYR